VPTLAVLGGLSVKGFLLFLLPLLVLRKWPCEENVEGERQLSAAVLWFALPDVCCGIWPCGQGDDQVAQAETFDGGLDATVMVPGGCPEWHVNDGDDDWHTPW
jgi:hypothetical protein